MPGERGVETFLDACGEEVDPGDLRIPKARAVARLLLERDDVGARLTGARRSNGAEWILATVEVDVGQAPLVDVRREEPIALGFAAADDEWPQTVSLRSDFPDDISHIFLPREGKPIRLCLSEEGWEEVRRRWSPAAMVRLVRTWLIDTARGALHRADQALEPFLLGSTTMVILPHDIFDSKGRSRPLFGAQVGPGGDRPIYRLGSDPALFGGAAPTLVAAAFESPPRQHGRIRSAPGNMADLTAMLQADDFDFGALVDRAIEGWLREGRANAHPVLLVSIPVTREADGEVERRDTWAFLSASTVRQMAAEYDLDTLVEGVGAGMLLGSSNRRPGPYGAAVRLEVLNPTFELSAEQAAVYSGLDAPSGRAILAVGAGALGSQVLANLARMGETVSGIVDYDHLFPHNLARHAAWDHHLLGWPKAEAVSLMMEGIASGARRPKGFLLNAAKPEEEGQAGFAEALAGADLILDMAASVPVSRYLAIDAATGARRVSAFLSPNGADLVLLAEDAARGTPLDHLEMNYYAAVGTQEGMAGHLRLGDGVRYARSCREVSARLPQTLIGVHAGIAAEQVRRLADSDAALAAVWRVDGATMAITRIELDVRAMLRFDAGGWTVFVAPALVEAARAARAVRLPVETGGVLLGDFDVGRRLVYLASSIPSPTDSRETATSYVRGSFGLRKSLEEAEQRTMGMLRYVGEWHSHPAGCPATPSGEDLALYAHLVREMEVEAYPPVMLIVGEDQIGLVVDGAFSGPAG